jgi:hypothetical protein
MLVRMVAFLPDAFLIRVHDTRNCMFRGSPSFEEKRRYLHGNITKHVWAELFSDVGRPARQSHEARDLDKHPFHCAPAKILAVGAALLPLHFLYFGESS